MEDSLPYTAPQVSGAPLESTSDHIQGVFDFLQTHTGVCRHFEMETYTWEVLPDDLGEGDVVNQLVRESTSGRSKS